ncbi:hypothetical protein C2E21_1293 [Chlorella sorokiniana]|uniref:RING-type domain-containing protein n=1 Tax=Chlorella sorokiniana TaxID=3076 RepID=A0A2P6U2J7_CHLSO|nr:hypothetical protein C2E21_1293 [Chlorella sorokiniana]|eukprot:PRW60537.1 hypothetical protein C2E21_1293 [Chlorella sorokiniana]
MGDAPAAMAAAAAVASGSGGAVPSGILALLTAGATQRLAVLHEGGPHTWGALALVFWFVWLCMQAPWHVLVHALRRNRAAAAAAGRPWRRDPAVLVLRTFAYGAASALLWMAHLDPSEFRSWEDVYFFCGRSYQHCTAGFRWNGGGWLQAFVLWNFVLSSALLLQKFVVALGLGGLLPGEEVVTRESFVSIAWRLVPYWLNQWEQQWGAECSSMLFELPHFALELLVVLPCVQIFCGRLRVMAQPHIRDPLPAAAAAGGEGAVAEAGAEAEAEAEASDDEAEEAKAEVAAAGHGAGPAAAAANGAADEAPAAAEGDAAGEAAAGEAPAAAAGAAAAAPQEQQQQQQQQDWWVPDVMRCRWRRDPQQRRLLPRLRANLRAMALAAFIIAVAASNSLLLPLALESRPATSPRADQILRFKKELSFLVSTGRHADTALWYQRLAAASAQTEHPADSSSSSGGISSGGGGSSINSNGGNASDSGSPEIPAPAPPPVTAPAFGMTRSGRGGDGAAGFLAAVLESSSNSSRLDAKLAVWSTLWQPLLPPHWLRAVLAADASKVAGLNPAYLSALQFVEHAESAELAQQLHAAANNPRACAEAQGMLQGLLPPHSGHAQAGSQLAGMLQDNIDGQERMVQLLLVGAMVAGIDAKAAPLRLKPTTAGTAGTAGLDDVTQADLEWLRTQQALYAAKAQLPAGLLLVASGHGSGSEDAAGHAAGSDSSGGSVSSGSSNATSVAALHLNWQQQQRMAPLYRLLHKHCTELERMRSTDHRHLIPLVELSLAIMRLSCERFFSLLAVFLGFLAFHDPPPAARRAIRVISLFASVFQRLVLYSFPAICWAYGAGALFSSFVSVVFWTGPLVRTVERLRSAAVSVQPRQWHHGEALLLMALPCGHAFHRECLQQWLQQCYGQGRGATCPMCQATIPLRVRYRLPFSHHHHRRHHEGAAAGGDPQEGEQQQRDGEAAAAAEGIPGLAALVAQLQDDFRARFEPMLDVPAGLGGEEEAQWPPPEAVLLPPDWPEEDLLLEEVAEEAAAEAAAAVAAAVAVQAPAGQAANVLAGAPAQAPGNAEAVAADAVAAAALQQAIEAVEAAEQLLLNPAQHAEQAQEPGLQPLPQQVQPHQAQPQPGEQQQQVAEQQRQWPAQQQPRRPGLFGRLLRRRRGPG